MNTPRLSSARAEMVRRVEHWLEVPMIHWLEVPMIVLGGCWLALLVLELLKGASAALDAAGIAIWIIFLLEFAFPLVVAPYRLRFLRRNWVTALSLLLPALRVLRIARVVRLLRAGRAVRALRLARLLTSFNRGMRALGSTMRHRGVSYVFALTVVVLLLGGAGIYAFERDSNTAGFSTFGGALWWTAMLLTTMGSEYWPRTPEGRLICLLLSIYAFAVFGYITATLASFFVGSDAEAERRRLDRLEAELVRIRSSLEQIRG